MELRLNKEAKDFPEHFNIKLERANELTDLVKKIVDTQLQTELEIVPGLIAEGCATFCENLEEYTFCLLALPVLEKHSKQDQRKRAAEILGAQVVMGRPGMASGQSKGGMPQVFVIEL